MEEDKQGEEQQISKRQKVKQDKKYKKKIAQSQGTICRAEDKPFNEIISQEPTKTMLVTHFGNGDEIDQNVIQDFCAEKGGPLLSLTIFPGINYGHLEFEKLEDAKNMMDTAMDSPNCANIEFPGSDNKERTVVFFYTPFKCSQLK